MPVLKPSFCRCLFGLIQRERKGRRFNCCIVPVVAAVVAAVVVDVAGVDLKTAKRRNLLLENFGPFRVSFEQNFESRFRDAHRVP